MQVGEIAAASLFRLGLRLLETAGRGVGRRQRVQVFRTPPVRLARLARQEDCLQRVSLHGVGVRRLLPRLFLRGLRPIRIQLQPFFAFGLGFVLVPLVQKSRGPG